MARTAVVILNRNGLEFLKKFLSKVVDFTADENTSVIVADNGSSDGSCKWIEENFTDIKLIKFDTNLGFAEGYNRALDEIDSEYYVLLNSDVEVTEGWLRPLISYLEKNPEVAACQPKILSYRKRDYFEYGGAAGGFIDKFGFTFCRGRIFDTIEKDSGQYDDLSEIFWSSGACMAVRAESWKKCGGLDPVFFAHMEEVDLCWRLRNAGYKVFFIPDSVVYHVGGGTLGYESPFKTYLNFRNNLFLLYKNLPESELHGTLFIRKLFDGLAAFRFLLKGRLKNASAVFKAHADYYRKIPVLRRKRQELILKGIKPQSLLLNKSVVFEFYLKGNKTFRSIVKNYQG